MHFRNGVRGLIFGLVLWLTAACDGLAGEPRIVATLPPRTAPVDVTAPLNAADTATGARIFAENCVRCHGIDGKGKGELVQTGQIASIPDFTDPATTRNITPQEWYAIIRDGRIEKLMPPWGSALTGEEIAAVALYTYYMAGQNQPPASPPQTASGGAVPLNSSLPLAIVLILAGIGFISLSIVLYIQSSRNASPPQTVESLAQTIAELDAAYQQGDIKERQYRKQRNALKKQLAVLVSQKPPQ